MDWEPRHYACVDLDFLLDLVPDNVSPLPFLLQYAKQNQKPKPFFLVVGRREQEMDLVLLDPNSQLFVQQVLEASRRKKHKHGNQQKCCAVL